MQKGDLVLVPFPFTDLSSIKKRPALVLVDNKDDVTLSFITTKLHWREAEDVVLKPTKSNGLKKQSLLRLAKITTLDKSLVVGKLGQISSKKMQELNDKLKLLFELQ